ncbi:MAG: bifunctional oligoribonuclease/PAP phosphatase NrnA [Bacilli bacterium]|nr:bifunctional oligoribonuclease/PAP phosphatase NrnA [Bacilli bacterium]
MKGNIFKLIKESKSILLLTHESPDGDAVGSVMGFYHMLKSINKSVDIVMPEVPNSFEFLASINKIVDKSDKEYDLAIVLDCANEERIGQKNGEFLRCKKCISIDHHTSNNGFGDINYVEEETAACSQVIYYLFKDWNILINKNIGEALAVGLLTDTCGFRNDNVDKKSFLMASELLDLGIKIHKLYFNVLSKKTMSKYLLMKMVLDRLEFFSDERIAFSYISQEDLENVSARPGDHEGLVDLGRHIDGVEVSIFMREDNGYRISFRSNGLVDVNKIAKKFGGGGHKMAAGAKLDGSFKEIKESLINEVIKVLNK